MTRDESRRRAEEALRTEIRRAQAAAESSQPYRWLPLLVAASALLAAEPEGKACGSISAVRSDSPPAQPLPTCANCGSNLIAPAPSPARDEVRESETPGTTRVEGHGEQTTDTGRTKDEAKQRDEQSDAASGAISTVLGVQPADGRQAHGISGGVPEPLPVLRRRTADREVTRDEVREAAEIVRAILTAHDARLSDGGCLTYGHPRSGTGFPAAIEWLRRYDAAKGGDRG